MKQQLLVLIALSAVSCSRSAPEQVAAPPKKMSELAGRTEGKTQRCLPGPRGVLFRVSDSDPNALIFDDGKRIWVSHMAANCQYEPGQTVIPDTLAAYYCSGDMVREGGRVTLAPSRYCALGSFTPYAAK
jgi:hypothetical protein